MGVFKVQPHKSGSCFPRLTAFQASFTGVILNVVLGGLTAGRGFLYPHFGVKQTDFSLIFFFFFNKVCICYAQSSPGGLEVPEACGSGVPGILTPQR